MEKDFHYYLVYSQAKITEQEKADVIAYASQFVDDNNEGCFLSVKGDKEWFPEKIETDNGNYYPIMTQSLSPKSLSPYVQKYVYVPFHFLPGDNTVEIDKSKNPLSTTPNSGNAKQVLKAALKSNGVCAPYRIGIALHTYADTWSHQNFTGLNEDWNSVYPWYEIFKSIAPNIGHAEAGHSPDVISETWTDHRFGKKIENSRRAFEATGEIYKALRKNTGKGPLWGEVKKDYREIIYAPNYDKRIELIDQFLNDNGKGPIPNYAKERWTEAALDRTGKEVKMRPGFENTDWHRFHQAAKSQFSLVLNLLQDL
jgi:hypothetical protein